jgi:DNA adenine methylase
MSDSDEMMRLFDDLDRQSEHKTKDTIIHAPFGYPGGKTKSIQHIIPQLPYRKSYIEPFGGSAAIMLARHTSPIEVYNDRYGGVVAFYRCIRDPQKWIILKERLELSVYSREEWVWSHETWENVDDDIERAARWYYMTLNSFANMGRNFGRATKSRSTLAHKLDNKLPEFSAIHERFRNVQVENQDWSDCIYDYDNSEAVFYLDPPYVDASIGAHKHIMSIEDHRKLLDTIFHINGFVALSGYSNPLYESGDWDNRIEWQVDVSLKALAFTDSNYKADMVNTEGRIKTTEVLWIKEAK